MSSNDICKLCNGQLLVRKDRPSFPVVYTECFGTVSGIHFRKYCQNNAKGCSFTQHYSFHTTTTNLIEYDRNCLNQPYFLYTNMTCFSTTLLTKLSAEILLGQISYKQKADIYNYMLMAMIHHLKRQQVFMKEPWIPGNLLYVCAINNIHTVRVIMTILCQQCKQGTMYLKLGDNHNSITLKSYIKAYSVQYSS